MKVHIGNIVAKLLKERGIKKIDFAVSMNYSKQNINSLLLKENWYINQVWQASTVLKYNLFSIYSSDNTFIEFERIMPSYHLQIKQLEEINLFFQTENKLLHNLITDKERIIELMKKRK